MKKYNVNEKNGRRAPSGGKQMQRRQICLGLHSQIWADIAIITSVE
jgi:hypothetical protein